MKHSAPLAFLDEKIAELASRGELRDSEVEPPKPLFGTNDYLGLTAGTDPAIGATGSRLLGGDSASHRHLESELADWMGTPSALLFSTGYAANVGALSALIGPDDLVLSDEHNHASIIDGLRLGRSRPVVAPHNDLEAWDSLLATRGSRRAWIVTESYFSMDADGPDPVALRALADRHGAALYVDEAHALGVFGPEGRGCFAEARVVPDVLIGTFGKAFGSAGAFVAGSPALRAWLWNRARSFVFSTAAPPLLIESLRAVLPTVRAADDARAHLHRLAAKLRSGLTEAGARVLGFGPIVPILLGRTEHAIECAGMLTQDGFSIRPIRPPTVALGTARLRLAVRADHTDADIEAALTHFRRLPWARWS